MRLPYFPVLLVALALTFCLALVSASVGPLNINLSSLFETHIPGLLGHATSSSFGGMEHIVLLELRLPRIALAVLVGCLLAQCGAVMQGVFRNPLADPGIIGVSSGAALGAILAIVLLPSSWKIWSIPLNAFLGGLLATYIVYGLARSRAGTSVLILLLAGVAVSAFTGAAIGFLSYFADDASLRELSVWQMGSLAGANADTLPIIAIATVFLGAAFQTQSRALNALLLGESEARNAGIDVERLKYRCVLLVALGVGLSVSYAGIIGFIGLVIPHLSRMLIGPNHQALLPVAGALGALLLLAADMLSRTIVSPAELPIGLITALLGAPFFTALLLRERKKVF